jgi:hypothetical protein
MNSQTDPKESSPFPTSDDHGKAPAKTPVAPQKRPAEGAIDHGIEESFPASDPVSVNVTKVKKP